MKIIAETPGPHGTTTRIEDHGDMGFRVVCFRDGQAIAGTSSWHFTERKARNAAKRIAA